MKFGRQCNILESNSFFLFGARGTGKSTLIQQRLSGKGLLTIDLLHLEVADKYLRNPDKLYDELRLNSDIKWVVLDEIQKVPALLDVVHRTLETREFSPPKFAISGSSARKLKHGNANLLAGRAFLNYLYPLTHQELGEDFDLNVILNWGSLPKIFGLNTADERREYLRSYGLVYLSEEVWAEHLVQKLEPFRHFLEVAAQMNGQLLQYANIAKDVGVDDKTIKKYFEILEDTHMGFLLYPYHRSIRKRQLQSPKFYFFDLGVVRSLARTLSFDIMPKTTLFGDAFEHFVISEIHRLSHYKRTDFRLSYIRTKDDAEIDLIIERPGRSVALVEIKSKDIVSSDDSKHLRAFASDFKNSELFVLSNDPTNHLKDNVHYYHWQEGLKRIGL
jgi:predicted AAA+ superfamily ATPase